MKALVLVAVLLFIPSITFAHSGTVFRSVVNYVPLAVAFVPLVWKSIAKLIVKLRAFRQRGDNR
ncbi:hypothetical protein [Sporomusa termitida]|uniref:Uncharacterized protein n=1 Tax=Sporomusa termitida TaxID=2377 RepID=A0A517E005_9FIRM|nr:hypothetical protein [Sporomusa termitida]QDR82937.1 hypothetical protein SPTER_43860 [Sporomusa termitida]